MCACYASGTMSMLCWIMRQMPWTTLQKGFLCCHQHRALASFFVSCQRKSCLCGTCVKQQCWPSLCNLSGGRACCCLYKSFLNCLHEHQYRMLPSYLPMVTKSPTFNVVLSSASVSNWCVRNSNARDVIWTLAWQLTYHFEQLFQVKGR